MSSKQSPVARAGRRGPSGTRVMAGDTTQRSQSLTSAHPSAGRIQMSALLINTSDFNLRSHGIAFSSPRSRLQRQFYLQLAQPPPCPGHPGPAAPLGGSLSWSSGVGNDPAGLGLALARCAQLGFWGAAASEVQAAHPSGYWLPAILSALPKTKAQLKHFRAAFIAYSHVI